MANSKSKRMWQAPWGYPESFAFVIGIVVIGYALQITIGSFNFFLLAAPINIYFGVAILGISAILGYKTKSNSFARWICSIPISVALISALLVLTIIMGLTPQLAEGASNSSLLGFNVMTKSWPFVLIYGLTLISLATLIFRKFFSFRVKDFAFYLNHIGLWLLLAASGLGYADMERYIMYVTEGETEWRVYDSNNSVKELSIAIELNDFSMEVYEPKITIIDRESGAAQPVEKPQYFQIDSDLNSATLNGWSIEVKEYIHKAIRENDSTYREVPMPGSTPAAFVKASNGIDNLEGWICSGSIAQAYKTLSLTEKYSLVMTAPEPKSFKSDIEVFTESGESYSAILEVNKPLRFKSWTIYQYGYDNNAGNLSSYSSFELVYDPWIIPVYIGIILMMLGSIAMIWIGRKRESISNDME